MKNINKLLIIFIILSNIILLLSCSIGSPTVELGFTNYSWLEKSYGRIKIFNSKGDAVGSPDAKVILDGVPLKSITSTGNYYNESILFNTQGISKERGHKIIIEYNKNKLNVDFQIPSLKKILITAEIDKSKKNILLKYKNLHIPSTIYVMRTVEKIENGIPTTISAGRHSKNTITKKINKSNGEMNISENFFQISEGRISEIVILLSSEMDVPLNSGFSVKSQFKILNEYKKIIKI